MTRRRLILLRHAKSSWKSDAVNDHGRPLNKRGRRDAPRVAAALRELDWVPDHVLASDSERTRETFARMAASLDFEGSALFLPDLYHGGVDELRHAVAGVDGAHETLLLLGHNPGWEEAAEWLTGQETVLKTGCAALLSVDAPSWPQAMQSRDAWCIDTVLRPRELG